MYTDFAREIIFQHITLGYVCFSIYFIFNRTREHKVKPCVTVKLTLVKCNVFKDHLM